LLMIVAFTFVGASFAQNGKRGDYWSDPLTIFETVVDESNGAGYEIQETALDWITDQQWPYARSYKISNTLDYVRQNMDPYLQWIIYAWLVLATISIIYSWFLLVTNSIHKQWDRTKIKTNIMYTLLWVFMLSWFYFVIKIMVALITSIFGWSWWDTWY
jgi:hypothetical protein